MKYVYITWKEIQVATLHKKKYKFLHCTEINTSCYIARKEIKVAT